MNVRAGHPRVPALLGAGRPRPPAGRGENAAAGNERAAHVARGGVQFTRRELRALYAVGGLLCPRATRGEGWGLPVHEALAMALPTVVTGVAGPLDITGGNGTAWLIDRTGSRGADGRAAARETSRRRCATFATIRPSSEAGGRRGAAGRSPFSILGRGDGSFAALGEGFFRLPREWFVFEKGGLSLAGADGRLPNERFAEPTRVPEFVRRVDVRALAPGPRLCVLASAYRRRCISGGRLASPITARPKYIR